MSLLSALSSAIHFAPSTTVILHDIPLLATPFLPHSMNFYNTQPLPTGWQSLLLSLASSPTTLTLRHSGPATLGFLSLSLNTLSSSGPHGLCPRLSLCHTSCSLRLDFSCPELHGVELFSPFRSDATLTKTASLAIPPTLYTPSCCLDSRSSRRLIPSASL